MVLPETRVVGNGFVALMAYQAQDYAYIAPASITSLAISRGRFQFRPGIQASSI